MNFLPLAAALAVGIYSAQYLNLFTAALSAVFFICLIFVMMRKRSKAAFDMMAITIAFVSGLCLYHYGSAPKTGTEFAGDYVTLHGCVCDLPYESNGINRYVVYTDTIVSDNEIIPLKSKVIVNSEKNFKCGDSVTVHGKLKIIEQNSADNAFNSRNYYAARGIYFKTVAMSMEKSPDKCRYLSLTYAANILRSNCTELIKRHYSGDIAAAMIAIITGDKHGFSDKYNDVLDRTGTRHLFYPAFVHISLITFLIGLTQIFVPKRLRDFMLVLILTVYMLISTTPSSLKIAAVLITVTLCKNIFGSGSYINSLSLFVLISGISNPMLMYDAGFVYSVASSFILKKFMPLLYGKNKIIRYICRYLIVVIGLAPLSIYFFGGFSIYSYIASSLFIPILMLVLFLSPLFLLNTTFKTTFPIAWLIDKFVMVLLHIPVLIDALPFSMICLPRPNIVQIAAFYCAMGAVWYYCTKADFKRRICAVISLGLLTSQLIYTARDFGKIEINFIDVGQGDATLIQLPASANILIDGGGAPVYSTYNIGENVFVPYLKENGAGLIQAAFVSHYHKDHVEGIIAAVEKLTVKHLFIPDTNPGEELRISLEQAAGANGTEIHYISEATRINIEDVVIDVIPPGEWVDFSDDINDTSMLVTLHYGDFDCLFTGDMTQKGEADLLSSGVITEAEVLKVAHHGSDSSSSKEMIDTVSPEYSLIGVGEDNIYGLPDEEVLQRFEKSRIFRTDECGTITLKADKNGNVSIETDR